VPSKMTWAGSIGTKMIEIDLFIMLGEDGVIKSVSTRGEDLLHVHTGVSHVRFFFEDWMMRDELNMSRMGDEAKDYMAYITYTLERKLLGWNLVDANGEPVPCCKESFERLPAKIGSIVMTRYFEKINDETKWMDDSAPDMSEENLVKIDAERGRFRFIDL